MAQQNPGEVAPAAAHALTELVAYGPGAVVSRTIAKGASGTLTLFAFDGGQGLSEHSAPFDAYVQILEGEAELVIGGTSVMARAGSLVRMPADVPHAVHAVTALKMLLVMLKEPR